VTSSVQDSPELVRLFETYTGAAGSIGAHYGELAERLTAHQPLIVATGFDIALYPGGGRPPMVEGLRLSTRGFKELAAVSHLGPAVATLARMKELEPDGVWVHDARRLRDSCLEVCLANDVELWRDRIGVAAFRGREESIAAMVDYACRATADLLDRTLSDAAYLTPERLRDDYLEADSSGLAVPLNRVMVATFFLTGLDLAHRLITWFDRLALPWEDTMVIVAGRQGRPTSGVTLESNSVAAVIETVSRGRLPRQHLLIAPHAPVFPVFRGDPTEVAALEQDYRVLWSSLIAMAELGQVMFTGYPHFVPASRAEEPVAQGTTSVDGMPPVSSPSDWFALTTRLRVVLEDPRQLLSGAVTDYAARELVRHDNDPARITVPGLDGEPYPELVLHHRTDDLSDPVPSGSPTATAPFRAAPNRGARP
jgi:hypothetical protein